jgi:hypothetical protein
MPHFDTIFFLQNLFTATYFTRYRIHAFYFRYYMSYNSIFVSSSLLSPMTLSFCLGAVARLVKSELTVPKDIYAGISLFLLFAIGLKGGHELSHATFASIVGPASVTIILGVITPLTAYGILRGVGRLSVADSAGVAAHYGSVSAVTFIAAQTFVVEILRTRPELPPLEGYLPTLVALMESPGIHVALALGVFLGSRSGERSTASLLHEVVTGRTMVLLVGGLVIGSVMGNKNWETIAPLFDPSGGVFKGLLCIFLLEMGMSAASRFGEIRSVGWFMLAFGIAVPIFHALLAIPLGHASGLSLGGTAVLATMAASASYIAAPPAVRATLPNANPAYYLTLALAITFPFNIIFGIPIYFQLTEMYFEVISLERPFTNYIGRGL